MRLSGWKLQKNWKKQHHGTLELEERALAAVLFHRRVCTGEVLAQFPSASVASSTPRSRWRQPSRVEADAREADMVQERVRNPVSGSSRARRIRETFDSEMPPPPKCFGKVIHAAGGDAVHVRVHDDGTEPLAGVVSTLSWCPQRQDVPRGGVFAPVGTDALGGLGISSRTIRSVRARMTLGPSVERSHSHGCRTPRSTR
jgi:hypothetical protein